MDGKFLARTGAAAFVGLAAAMTLVQLRDEPTAAPEARRAAPGPVRDPLPAQLLACTAMGEAALAAPACLAAWAENRRRFFDVDHPDAYAGLAAGAVPVAPEAPTTAGTGSR